MPRALALAFVLVPTIARAYSYDAFYGWSPDGTFYLMTSAGTDGIEHPRICLTDTQQPSPTWPKGLEQPGDDACAPVCEDEINPCDKLGKAQAWVGLPAGSDSGPSGHSLKLRIADGRANVTVLARGGKKVIDYEFGAFKPTERPRLLGSWWRPDAVAVLVGTPERGDADGYPPARYVAVIPFAARSAAAGANARGMKLLRQRDYRGAAEAFRKAIGADPQHVLAHYNLACASALAGDRKTAIAELRWVAASSKPEAEAAFAKAPRDADLKDVIGDPEVKKLVGASCDDRCELRRDGCEQECSDRNDDVGLRGCVRLCGSAYDDCAGRCKK